MTQWVRNLPATQETPGMWICSWSQEKTLFLTVSIFFFFAVYGFAIFHCCSKLKYLCVYSFSLKHDLQATPGTVCVLCNFSIQWSF